MQVLLKFKMIMEKNIPYLVLFPIFLLKSAAV